MNRGYGYNMPPGTAAGRGMVGTSAGRPPPTATRLRTGQVPATPGTQAAQGIAVSTSVQVHDRPVTQQGMMGMKVNRGPGRQVQDSSFFIGVINKKNAEIQNEIRTLKTEIDRFNRDSSQYNKNERKYETLLKEVRSLEGTLADYNLAMDKTRMSTDPTDVENYMMQLKNKNQDEAQEIDRIFLMKNENEKKINEFERQIFELHRQAEEKINQLEPRKLSQYKQLLEHSNGLRREADEKRAEIEKLQTKIRDMEANQKDQSHRDEYERLEKRLRKLEREKLGLEEELQIAQLDPKEAHQRLLAKVKEDKSRAQELDGMSKHLDEELQRMRRHLHELNNMDAAGGAGHDKKADEEAKFEKLQERDREMSEFIDSFAMRREKLLTEQAKGKQTVVALLEHISQGLDSGNNLPTTDELSEMKDETTFKTRQLETSQMTMKRLQQERAKREQELEKISNLDGKISIEMAGLTDKMRQMREEMVEFDDVDGLRRSAEVTQDYLQEMRRRYVKRRDTIKLQVQLLSSQYEVYKRQLASNETAKQLESLEQKLRHYEQGIFTLREYIATKGQETDYESLRDECNSQVTRLNVMIQKAEEMAKYSANA